MDKREREEVSPIKKRLCNISTPKKSNSCILKVSNLPDAFLEFNSAEVPPMMCQLSIVYYRHALSMSLVDECIYESDTLMEEGGGAENLIEESMTCNDNLVDNDMGVSYLNRDEIFMSNETIGKNCRPSTSSTPYGNLNTKMPTPRPKLHSRRSLVNAFCVGSPKSIVDFSCVEDYTEDLFQDFLRRGLEKKCNLKDEKFFIRHYNEDLKSVTVELDSSSTAEKVVENLQSVEFMYVKLVLKLVTPPPALNSTRSVKNKFRNFLQRGLDKRCDLPHEIFSLEAYNKNEKSIVVEFTSPETATIVVDKLQFAVYMLEKLVFTIEDAAPAKREQFSKFLTVGLEKKCDLTPFEIFSVESHNEQDNSVVVEFDSEDTARKVVDKLNGVEYMYEELILTLAGCFTNNNCKKVDTPNGESVKNIPFSDEEPEDEVALKDSEYCRILNVQNMPYNSLKSIIEAKMAQANFARLGEKTIKKILHHDKESVIAKFRTSEEANLSTLLEGVFNGDKLIKIRKCLYSGEFSGPSVVEGNISIQSEEGKAILLRGLIRLRSDFKKHIGCLDFPLSKLQQCLLQHNVVVAITDLRNQRRTLMETHRKQLRQGKTGPYTQACKVAFDEGSVALVENTVFDPAQDTCKDDNFQFHNENTLTEDLAKFCKVATWTVLATKALISICIENFEEYDKPVKHSDFWSAVSLELYNQKFYYSAKQCENRMDTLKRQHKDYDDNRLGTGAAAPSQQGISREEQSIMGLMSELLQGDVTYRPKVTCSVGVTASKLKLNTSDEQTVSHTFRVGGRTRPVILEGKKSRAERMVQAVEKRSDALMLIAQEQSRGKKSGKNKNKKKKKQKQIESSSDSSDSSDSEA
ncbi:Rubredoxin-NAD(+) reductase [Frankliniella fusca]|uniref:Rubredoxin-NAD(+) reductase n=1 Tax=Frankliniella fusca TaxID=407009 RepID=A0AAE1LBZ1_9NEOP|nr:Rubredoxin-NAD(+) reductase [Frankliniella fusca]